MDILYLAKESLKYLAKNYQLPKSGFIAGGSLANLIWEKVSGVKAVINDIDVYVFEKAIEYDERELKKGMHFIHKEKYLYDDYSGLRVYYKTKEFYTIDHVDRDGFLNTIYYKSSNECPLTILKSFDINCCQVGYDIKTEKFYWTQAFENFIKSGKLQIVNLSSPSHTAIRLVKKKDELKAQIDSVDFDMIEFTLTEKRFLDVAKLRFKDRYAELYRKYQDELNQRFELKRDSDTERWLSATHQLSGDDKIWKLDIKNNENNIFNSDKNISSIIYSTDFIFYVRNIFNTKYEKIWYQIYHLFNLDGRLDEYIDIDISTSDLDLLHNIIKAAPESVNNLRGFTISKQLSIVKKMISKYESDPIIAIALLEKYRIDEIENQDEFGTLLLELSVRKNIIDDPRGKVAKLLNSGSNDNPLEAYLGRCNRP